MLKQAKEIHLIKLLLLQTQWCEIDKYLLKLYGQNKTLCYMGGRRWKYTYKQINFHLGIWIWRKSPKMTTNFLSFCFKNAQKFIKVNQCTFWKNPNIEIENQNSIWNLNAWNWQFYFPNEIFRNKSLWYPVIFLLLIVLKFQKRFSRADSCGVSRFSLFSWHQSLKTHISFCRSLHSFCQNPRP